MKLRRLVYFSAALATLAGTTHAQQLFPGFKDPGTRGTTGTEYTSWDLFFNPYNAANFGDVAAAASAPSITQTLTDTAFLTSGFNIYSFSAATGYELANDVSTTLAAPLTSVVFQFDTLGTFIDYSSIKLNYAGGTISLDPASLISESRVITGGFGGFTNRVAVQWNLTGLNITDYTITFESLGSSNSFNLASLDTSKNAYTEIVASARTWDGGAGSNLWSAANNWSGDTVTTLGGNVTFATGAPATVELDSNREVGQLTLTNPGNFKVASASSSTLTINTGITANGGAGSSQEIAAPIFMGGHNFIDVKAGNTLTLSKAIGGSTALGAYPAAGIYKEGDGTLILSGNNTFKGGVTVDGGTLAISGVNQYTDSTSVLQGSLVAQGNAPSGANGVFGNATSNVVVGYDPGTSTGLPPAQLFIDGNFTIGRNISVSVGTLTKVIGARNATGALYSGDIQLGSTTDNVFFRAEGAADVVSFSGQITGSATTKTLTKDGAGTVVFSGANKAYASATNIAAGTLNIATGTAFTGNGNMTVAAGAKLIVQGSLSGSGTLSVNGGTIGGNGTINRVFTLDTDDVLSPGNSVGTLNTIGETWAGGGKLKLEMSDVDAGAGLGWDFVNINGALSLTANSSSKFTLELSSLLQSNTPGLVNDFNGLTNYTWSFLTASGGIAGFSSNAFAINTAGFTNAFNGSFSVTQTGNNLNLVYTVPEPTSTLLALTGLALLGTRRRRTAAAKRAE